MEGEREHHKVQFYHGLVECLLGFVCGMVVYTVLKNLHQYSTRKAREEASRAQIPRWETIDWAEVDDSKDLMKVVLSRVIEKLHVLKIREPSIFVGVAEHVKWMRRELMDARAKPYYAPEALMDVAYDSEDVIDDLVLKSRKGGIWNKWILLIIIHWKLKLIKSKLPALPLLPIGIACGGGPDDNYFEEIIWSDIALSHSGSMAKTVVSPVEEKVSALLSHTEITRPSIKKAARRILDKFSSLSGHLRSLESKELDNSGMVWMEELSHVALSAVIAIEDFITKKQQQQQQLRTRSWMRPGFLSAFGKLKYDDEFSAKMDSVYAKIQRLSIHRPAAVLNQQGLVRTKTSAGTRIQPESTMREHDFASFGDDLEAMISRLLTEDDSFRVIPIIGMEGMGKTALAKLAFNHDTVVQHFPLALWTSNNCQFHLRHKERTMEYDLSEPGDGWSYDGKMRQLKAFLISKRSLLVVDDDSCCPYEMLNVLQGTLNGSRMILTRSKTWRPQNPKMKTDPHLLRLRTDEESWALFAHALNMSIPPKLFELKDTIPKRCGGLPLVIVKLAEVLSNKAATMEEWSATLQQFSHEQQQLWSHTLYKIHNDLSLYMRRCLFYFTLFPQDFDIPARRLIALWVAEDLVQPEGDNKAPEDVAERCLNLLIAQGMVQLTKKKLNGNVKMVRLPDFLRQYWLSKTQQATFLGVHTNTRSELSLGTNKIRRLVDHLDQEDISFNHIHGGDKATTSTPLTPYYEAALSFLSFDTRRESKSGEEAGNFLHRGVSSSCFLMLLVLDLENVFRPKLPDQAIGKLTQLRYLGLRSTFLEKVPSSISKLKNLQTLDMKHTSIKTLPDSIWKLQRLRHLYLTESSRSKIVLQRDANLAATIETLCGLFLDEEAPVKDGLDRLARVRKLGLTVSSKRGVPQEVVEWVLKLSQLRSLRLKSIDENNQPRELDLTSLVSLVNLSCIYLLGGLRNNPSIVSQFPNSLIDLTLSGSGLVEDPMQSLDKLPNLKSLKLLAKSYVGKTMICSPRGFPQLRVLKLWRLEQLEEWNVEEGAVPALRNLEIRFCTSLNTLPTELLLRNLLKIEVLPSLKPRFLVSSLSCR